VVVPVILGDPTDIDQDERNNFFLWSSAVNLEKIQDEILKKVVVYKI